jgi:hypothetical protein
MFLPAMILSFDSQGRDKIMGGKIMTGAGLFSGRIEQGRDAKGVLPFQGKSIWGWPSSQGDALGY